MNNLPTIASEERRWDLLFRELRPVVGQPSAAHLASRVWKQRDLVTAITVVRKANQRQLMTTFPTADAVVQRMEDMGWLQSLRLTDAGDGKSLPRLYLLDMEATHGEMPDVLEVLQGYQPKGVLCYFGVLALHELTTQVAPFYHVARLQEDRVASASPRTPTPSRTFESTSERNPLGTPVFRYQNVTCYDTKRDHSMVPGTQTRIVGPRTQLRVTTLEQTLLDTLIRPLHCGGEAVVFEAWERASTRWNTDRMTKLLEKIKRPDLDRRVAAILALVGVDLPACNLRARLDACHRHWQAAPDEPPISLLPGFVYAGPITPLGVQTP